MATVIPSYQQRQDIKGIVPYSQRADGTPCYPKFLTLTVNSSGLHDTVAVPLNTPIRLIDAVTSETDKFDLYTAGDNNGGACVFAGVSAFLYSANKENLGGVDLSDKTVNRGKAIKAAYAGNIQIFDPSIVKYYLIKEAGVTYMKDETEASNHIGSYVDVSGGQSGPDSNGDSQAVIVYASPNATKGIKPFRIIGLAPWEKKTTDANTSDATYTPTARVWVCELVNSIYL